MTRDLWSHTRLRSQTGNGNDTRQHPSYPRRLSDLPELGRIGEEAPVLVIHDEDGEIRVRVCEFGEELAVEGTVDRGPEGLAPFEESVDILGIGVASWFRR